MTTRSQASPSPKTLSFESMGTSWEISIWDALHEDNFIEISHAIENTCRDFDDTYSRFKEDSLVSQIARSGAGVYSVPEDFIQMLRLYFDLYELSGRIFNPLVGFSLSDLGYDAAYSLKTSKLIRETPSLPETISILEHNTIEVKTSILIDIGALGKGFAVDKLFHLLENAGCSHFLVNGSGDIRYKGSAAINAGLEDPQDPSKAIGVFPLAHGSFAGSGVNRRTWGKHSHIINALDPENSSPLLASWVHTESTVLADALATALLLSPPEPFLEKYDFSYCLMNHERRIKKSADFSADFF